MTMRPIPRRQAGFSMIEVLITIVIVAIGLMGLAGLQAMALVSQKESYHRAKALALVDDMAYRLAANRANADAYVTTLSGARGTGFNSSNLLVCESAPGVPLSGAALDLCEWHNNLLGATEKSGTTPLSAMYARGCVIKVAVAVGASPARYVVAVAWQGQSRTFAPSIACGSGQYGNEAMRRLVSLPVTIPHLD
jgi:type IV pilus assembly protein PilV